MLTRARILDSAVHTFLRRGLSHASLADIADVAGVTRGAVYGHFKNKSALFEAMFDDAALPIDPFRIEWLANPQPLTYLRIELVRLLTRVLSSSVERRLYSVIYSRCEISDDTKYFWEKVHAERRTAEQRIESALADARSDGQLCSQADIPELAVFIHSCMLGFFIRSLGVSVPAEPRESAERFVDLALLLLSPFETQVGSYPRHRVPGLTITRIAPVRE